MNSKYSVSTIITAHNCQQYVGEAIESVLGQTVAVDEILVIDDGSVDETVDVINQYRPRVRLIRQDNLGCSVARNVGFRASCGEFISFLDCDDLWSLQRLELQLKCLDGNPALDVVSGHFKNFISYELSSERKSQLKCSSESVPCNLPNSFLIRRSAFERVGCFDESLTRAEGLDWYSRAVDCGLRMEMLDDLLYYRRLFKEPKAKEEVVDMGDYARFLKKTLDRRRLASQ